MELLNNIRLVSNLEVIADRQYRSINNDPQIWFGFEQPKDAGWYKIKIKSSFPLLDMEDIAAKIYVDFGDGFSEAHSHNFNLSNRKTSTFYIKFNQSFSCIRFDPHENIPAGVSITINAFELIRMSKYAVLFDHVIKDRRKITGFAGDKLKKFRSSVSRLKQELKQTTIDYAELPAKEEKQNETGAKVFHDVTYFLRNKSADHKEKREFPVINSSIKPIAFYLPQFHPIKENDKNWGTGFTEWTNVTKTFSQFEGHYQPHLPADLGFYNLTDKNAIRKQVDIAKLYGIHAFCFYHYWFQGKRVLEKPLDLFYENKDLDMNFMICWANENWTKRWDGLEGEVLLRQDHNEQTDNEYIKSVVELFKDPRYVKIDNKPVLMVYKPVLFPNFKETVGLWRKLIRKHGFDDLFVISVKGFDCDNAAEFGLDALVEFPPATPAGFIELDHQDQKRINIYNPDFKGKIYDYRKVANNLSRITYADQKVFRGIMPSWDNTPRRNNDGHIFHFSTPAYYKKWLYAIAKDTYEAREEKEQFIFINAWNEWAEGTHLEPDRYLGYSILDATAQVLEYFPRELAAKTARDKKNIGFCIHIYHFDLWPEIAKYLLALKIDFHLFINLTNKGEKATSSLKRAILDQFPGAVIKVVENKGRDILPFIEFIDDIIASDCKYLCKIHTKKSLHREDGDSWRTELYDKLLGSNELVLHIERYFESYPEIGILGPEGHLINSRNYWGENKRLFRALLKKLQYELKEEFHFVAGSMFWIHTDILKTVKLLELTSADFESEAELEGIKDGTMSHAVERIFTICCQLNNRIVADTRILHGHLGHDFDRIVRYDPNNYKYAVPIPGSFF